MTIQEKTQKELAAEEALRQAKARLARVKKEEREKMRKEQNHHKYMMGGVVAKCFPEGYSAYDFSELELLFLTKIITVFFFKEILFTTKKLK